MTFRALPCALLLSSLLFAGCGGSSNSGTSGGGGGITTSATHYVYTSAGSSTYPLTVQSYSVASLGTANVSASTVPALTGMRIFGLKGDGAGNIYVLYASSTNFVTPTFIVTVFKASNGVLTQTRSFTATVAVYPSGPLAVDKSGNVAVGLNNGTVAIFNSSASGAVTPTSIFNVGYNYIASLAFDSTGNLYVSIPGMTNIYEYAGGLASSTPIRTIALSSYFTGIGALSDVAVDASNNLYVLLYTTTTSGGAQSSVGSVLVFGSTGTSPTRTITGTTTQLLRPSALAFDSSGVLYVADEVSTSNYNESIATFSAGSTGNIAPTTRFGVTDSIAGPSLQIAVY